MISSNACFPPSNSPLSFYSIMVVSSASKKRFCIAFVWCEITSFFDFSIWFSICWRNYSSLAMLA